MYENRLILKFAQSSQRLLILCHGSGLEPHIEFDHPLLEFGPILPHGTPHEKEIIIRNPGKFPIEIYNLEYDKLYLEEEKVILFFCIAINLKCNKFKAKTDSLERSSLVLKTNLIVQTSICLKKECFLGCDSINI